MGDNGAHAPRCATLVVFLWLWRAHMRRWRTGMSDRRCRVLDCTRGMEGRRRRNGRAHETAAAHRRVSRANRGMMVLNRGATRDETSMVAHRTRGGVVDTCSAGRHWAPGRTEARVTDVTGVASNAWTAIGSETLPVRMKSFHMRAVARGCVPPMMV